MKKSSIVCLPLLVNLSMSVQAHCFLICEMKQNQVPGLDNPYSKCKKVVPRQKQIEPIIITDPVYWIQYTDA